MISRNNHTYHLANNVSAAPVSLKMGAYLSEPITEKVSTDQTGKNISYGASSMQGWRISQEDAHNACIEFDEDVSLFAVYDGHGGHEVAAYCARNLPDFIKNTEAYKNGDIKQALIDAFLGFDATLVKPDVINILKEIAGTKDPDKKKDDDDESDEEENINSLCMEAQMPLEQVMAKYQSEGSQPPSKNEKNEINNRIYSNSPYLRSRKGKEKASCSSSGAGCSSSSSSSSSSWNTNESDVSSSSQPCGSSSADRKDCVASSEAEQVLDSTTSNGEVAETSDRVASTQAEESESAKSSADMPDSSEDIKDKVSPSKTSPEKSTNDTEVINGGSGSGSGVNAAGDNGSKENLDDADSSKAGTDSAISSSCSPVDNGETEEQAKISSSNTRKRPSAIELYKSLLQEYAESIENPEEEDDDDDEEDESFVGNRKKKSILRQFDEMDDSDDDDDDEEEEEEDEEDDDDEDDDDDDEDEDEEMYNDDINMNMTEEPGSDSGCTAVVALLKGSDLYVANAGDSRCVLCRDGNAVELSFDHKPEDQPEMDRIIKAGGKVTADGRVNGGLNLSRAIGDHAYKLNVELSPQEQMISALPDIRHMTIDLEKDEFMVLACDGIWNFMTSQDVIQFVRTRLKKGCQNVSKICEELFDHCLAPNVLGDGTGCDNMTAVIVLFKPSLPVNDVSNSASEQTVTKKRPVTPGSPEAKDCTTHDTVIDECKRQKTEAV